MNLSTPSFVLACAAGALAGAAVGPDAPTIEFNRDIRPLLADNCLACHGPDQGQREAGLRLDRQESALARLESGGFAIVPGDVENSLLVQRIEATHLDVRMPPVESRKVLSPDQVALLKQWVAQGAPWQQHWAWTAPQRPELPPIDPRSRPRTPIDRFILARLDREGLTPAQQSDKHTMIRRVSFDLTGLPPSLAQIDDFVTDRSEQAYENLVNRLLASPHFGERMALHWLDLARYADTHGYHVDSGREMWPWRDWVIEAFNQNMPFDRFTIEQLAGDLLPGATQSQIIATGFNRNTMVNYEGGIEDEEFRVEYVVDRVETTSTVWLGLTMTCSRCHDHKYDPLTMRDYYRLFAFFNNTTDKGFDGAKGNALPFVKLATTEQLERLADLTARIDALQARLDGPSAEVDAAEQQREQLQEQLQEQITELQQRDEQLQDAVTTTMVMQELPEDERRQTHMLIRGRYDQHGEVVAAGTPAALPPMPPGSLADRRGLAQWLVDPANPLTARVAVNRYWQMLFGRGLVPTSDNFGTRGGRPSHPKLLDYLAVEFVESGWDIKALIKQIVMSSAYRQSSRAAPHLFQRDPNNVLLARGVRQRLEPEFLRDLSLSVGGLLVNRIGGPSVKPYQPPGLWREISYEPDSGNYSAQVYEQDVGDNLYRRSLYTFWKRTLPPPNMAAFDAPNRELCTVQRSVTNTPLQALVLLNDPTFVEAARALGERIMTEPALADAAVERRIAFAFRLATARTPNLIEQAELLGAYQDELAFFENNIPAAQKLLGVGDSQHNPALEPAELAAWTTVASVILNLDETITKR
ncbi:PSD1 and planctomycete cytochrome C domain-containing protein [Pirellulales bacterium]|nr:PSD1 and planctomycete cytochrome C domain-containing protein [Pirellulales bacterium]